MPISTIFMASNVWWYGPADGEIVWILTQHRHGPPERVYSGSAVVDLISSIDSKAVTLCTFTSEISA